MITSAYNDLDGVIEQDITDIYGLKKLSPEVLEMRHFFLLYGFIPWIEEAPKGIEIYTHGPIDKKFFEPVNFFDKIKYSLFGKDGLPKDGKYLLPYQNNCIDFFVVCDWKERENYIKHTLAAFSSYLALFEMQDENDKPVVFKKHSSIRNFYLYGDTMNPAATSFITKYKNKAFINFVGFPFYEEKAKELLGYSKKEDKECLPLSYENDLNELFG